MIYAYHESAGVFTEQSPLVIVVLALGFRGIPCEPPQDRQQVDWLRLQHHVGSAIALQCTISETGMVRHHFLDPAPHRYSHVAGEVRDIPVPYNDMHPGFSPPRP